MLQVLVGGGQEASQVTTVGARSGNFQSRFFHKVRALLCWGAKLSAVRALC